MPFARGHQQEAKVPARAAARACPHDIEKQTVNTSLSFSRGKIFTSLLKSACRFEKERYFRTPFFRKEKR
jgi:hypothetical protein